MFLCSVYYTGVAYVAKFYWVAGREEPFLTFLFMLATIATLVLYFRICNNDPGYIRSLASDPLTMLESLKQQQSTDQYCSTCLIEKPIRSKHCRTCNQCVSLFDHHCPFTGNCVTRNNLGTFVILIILLQIDFALIHHFAFIWFISSSNGDLTMQSSLIEIGTLMVTTNPCILTLLLWVLFNQTWLFGILAQHLIQICLNVTTNEAFNFYRYPHMNKNGRYYNRFNKGIINNILEFISSRFE